MMHVIKKTGKREKFNEKKVYRSAYNACLSSEMDAEIANRISQNVVKEIRKLTKDMKEIRSDLIFNHVKRILARHNKECAFMYETHRDIS